MVELYPVPFADLVDRMHLEFSGQQSIFDLPAKKWLVPDPAGPDIAVRFHGHHAATPVGPASGPHTQMAQNLVLSWLAGSRIIEFKTIQINDQLTIPRPCIDAANVCYNVEWSQELRIAQSVHEYVAGTMLVHILRQGGFFEHDLAGPLGATVWDMSVGYDLAGIRSEAVTGFIRTMQDAGAIIDRLRLQIPARHARLRDLDYPARLSNSITLSTFHGCPADEIEKICMYLLTELGVDCVVKMNPPMLGQERLEHLLHDVMGYTDLQVNPSAYSSGLQFDEAVDMCRRLRAVADRHGRGFGAKFSNTLEVLNHRSVFTADNKVMYLSGPPLHVITLTLAEVFREAIGPDLPLTFSAGVDQQNFADMVAAGFCPVTTCTDLLKPGGYGRLPKYLSNLHARMQGVGAGTLDDFILDACGQREASGGSVARAGAANLTRIAEQARRDERYWACNNNVAPKRVGTHLAVFDCVTCDKCVPVCPNDANFVYDLPVQKIAYRNWRIADDGSVLPGEAGELAITKKHQIANFADFCNECGNCDTFCPEYGGPFIEKPSFFGSLAHWQAHPARDGFYIEVQQTRRTIHGRLRRRSFVLEHDLAARTYRFADGTVVATFPPAAGDDDTGPPVVSPVIEGHTIDMEAFHTLRLLLTGLLAGSRVHQVNVSLLASMCADP